MPQKIELDKMSAAELHQLIQDATELLETKKGQAKQDLMAEFKEKAAQLGLELGDLVGKPSSATQSSPRARRKDAGGSVAPRYKGPNGELWSGRGRMPKWLQALEAEGRRRDEFGVG